MKSYMPIELLIKHQAKVIIVSSQFIYAED